MQVTVIGTDRGVINWLETLGHEVSCLDGVEGLEKIVHPDLVVFTGGSDVSPFLYNEANVSSGSDAQRDAIEALYYHKFFTTPKLGICRGGQFLHVMNGGSMIQDYPNHAVHGTHKVYNKFSELYYEVTSTHHQIMKYNNKTTMMVSAELSKNETTSEVLWYPASLSMCFQPHPEYEKPRFDEKKRNIFARYGTNALLSSVMKDTRNPILYQKSRFEDFLEAPEPQKRKVANLHEAAILLEDDGFRDPAQIFGDDE
jgi:GMP synthase-like glutamine amidotransferase